MKNEDKIVRLAYSSRFFLICLQYIANLLIPDHDAKVFLSPPLENKTDFDKAINHLLGGFVRWDAQYFFHIAKYGYTYENTLAFFPLYPLVVRGLGGFLGNLVGQTHLDSILLLVFVFFNGYVFKLAALALYRVTEHLFDQKVAYNSAVLFCFSPASVFFVAPYTETLFSYLTFSSIENCFYLYTKYSKGDKMFGLKDSWLLLPIALSTVTRSNGVLNIGFLMYTFVCLWCEKKKKTLVYGLLMFGTLACCLAPFIAFQYYCFREFCRDFPVSLPREVLEQAKKDNFVLPGGHSKHNQSWCSGLLPLAYSYVQNHYWNVGFLRYYELKQLPNFLLAFPILFLLVSSSLRHLYVNLVNRQYYKLFVLGHLTKVNKVQINRADLCQPKLTVFYVHGLFLALFCLFFIHVQVSTRLLCSASPVFYWVSSRHLNLFKMPLKGDSLIELFLRTYVLSYVIAGTLLFCNFLPWT